MEAWYDQTLARCDAALARQTALMARLVPNTTAYALAEDMMAALQHTKTIFVTGQRRRLAAKIYQLRFELMAQYRMRGQIIASAALRINHNVLFEVLEARGDDLDEVWQCLELYRNWRDFCKAQRWHLAEGHMLPENLNDALAILNQWKLRRAALH